MGEIGPNSLSRLLALPWTEITSLASDLSNIAAAQLFKKAQIKIIGLVPITITTLTLSQPIH